jgi:predicted house-cleaning NTP pyrophosphatase (Maf/HAM1 superfamily)
MLRGMRGQTHRVYTGVCVRHGQKVALAHEITRVTFGDFR